MVSVQKDGRWSGVVDEANDVGIRLVGSRARTFPEPPGMVATSVPEVTPLAKGVGREGRQNFGRGDEGVASLTEC